MRSISRGWRSSRGYAAPAAVAAPVAPFPAAQRLTSEPVVSAAPSTFVWPWQNVKWNLAFVGFCGYSIAVITYIAPIGRASMIVALLGLIFGQERIRFPAPLVCFIAYYLFAAATAPTSEWYVVVKDELINIGIIGLIFLVAMNVLTERSRLRFYIFLTLATYGMYPVRGAIFNQFIYHAAELGRIAWNGMFANPNDLIALLLFPLGLAVGYLYAERQKYFRYAALLGIALISLIAFMTQSRGGILALGFFGAWTLARQKRRARMLPAVLGIVAVVVLFAPNDVWDRLKKISSATSSGELIEADDLGSAEQRFEIWKVAAAISRDHPITGIGLGAYSYMHWRYVQRNLEGFKRTAQGKRDAHSSYLTALAETGIIGFTFWIGIFVTTMRTVLRVRRTIKQADPDGERQLFFAQLGMMAFAVAGIFGSWNHTPYTYINVAILYGMAVLALEKHRARLATPQLVRRVA
ncbi:MAG: O-antigen ligase family protein [Gemmatimonadaceae bacterium]